MPNPHNPDMAERQRMSGAPNWFVFDIETGVRSEVLADPGQWFKPDARLTDPVKIKASLTEKAASGALSPVTGMVLAIGYGDEDRDWCDVVSDTNPEKQVIERFIVKFTAYIHQGRRVCGFNVLDFDIPFLLLRAKANRLVVPPGLGGHLRGRFQPTDMIVDLMLLSMYGRHDRAGYSLDKVCRALGIQGKNGDGALFQDLLATDKAKAVEYLLNDVRRTRELAEVLL